MPLCFGIVRNISRRAASRSCGSRAALYSASARLYSGVTLVGTRPFLMFSGATTRDRDDVDQAFGVLRCASSERLKEAVLRRFDGLATLRPNHGPIAEIRSQRGIDGGEHPFVVSNRRREVAGFSINAAIGGRYEIATHDSSTGHNVSIKTICNGCPSSWFCLRCRRLC